MSNESETKTVESKPPEYTIENVLPYPIIDEKKKEEKCQFCNRLQNEHNYMDFFLHPSHVAAVRIFWDWLKLKHDRTEITLLRLATDTPKTILSNKEMMLKLIEIGYNPRMTTWIPQIGTHYIPSEKLDYKHRSITVKLHTARVHYDGYTLYWETDFLRHKQLADPEEKTVERALEQVITEPLYKEFLEVHGLDAEIDYRFVQKEFHQIAATVNANLNLTEKYLKEDDAIDAAARINEQKYREGGGTQHMPYFMQPPRYRIPRPPQTNRDEQY